MPLARRSWMRRAAVTIVAVLIAGLCAVVARATPKDAAVAEIPGPHDQARAIADGKAAGAQRSNTPSAVATSSAATTASPRVSAAAAAPGSGARVPGFVSFHVYATQYAPNTQGS